MELNAVFEKILQNLLVTRELQDCLILAILDKHTKDIHELIKETITTSKEDLMSKISKSYVLNTIAEDAVRKNEAYLTQVMGDIIKSEEFKKQIGDAIAKALVEDRLNISVAY